MNPYEMMAEALDRYHSGASGRKREKLAQEMMVSGYATVVDFLRLGVGAPWVFSSKMEDFYRESDAFVYALLVWHHGPERMRWRKEITARIARLAPGGRVLCLGDGIGYDALQIALDCPGTEVTTFEFTGFSSSFAERMFEDQKMASRLTALHELSAIPSGAFDVVVCLDVLEHVPAPREVIADIGRYLKPDGRAFISEAFGNVEPLRPTHLLANLPLCGRTISLFRAAGFGFQETFAGRIFHFHKGAGSPLKTLAREELKWRVVGEMAVRRFHRHYPRPVARLDDALLVYEGPASDALRAAARKVSAAATVG